MLKFSVLALFFLSTAFAAEKISCDFKGGLISAAFKQTIVLQTSSKDKPFAFKRNPLKTYFRTPLKYTELFEGLGVVNFQTAETEPTAEMLRAVMTPYFSVSNLTQDGLHMFNYGFTETNRSKLALSDRLRIFFASREIPFEMSSNGFALFERVRATGEIDRFVTPGGWGVFNCERLP